jgi:hypothetical protein
LRKNYLRGTAAAAGVGGPEDAIFERYALQKIEQNCVFRVGGCGVG